MLHAVSNKQPGRRNYYHSTDSFTPTQPEDSFKQRPVHLSFGLVNPKMGVACVRSLFN